MAREYELKFSADERTHADLQARFRDFHRIQMETTYYDTADGLLAAGKMTLRLRRENEACICTLKTPLPDGSRGEWECTADSIEEGMQKLMDLGAPQLLQGLSPIPVCGARFLRMAAQIPTADGTAELALDAGVLLGGGREIPLCEVELELKSGSDRALELLSAQLAAQYGLTPEPRSKFLRASLLAQGE